MSNLSKNFLLGCFEDEEHLVNASKELREKKIPIFDVYTPFPVHGLDDLLEIKRSRLPIICFFAALVGLGVAFWFQIWTSKVSWPLNVGGKPFNSFTAFIPVAFEITILFGALVTVAAFFFRSRLFPGKDVDLPDIRVTEDTFVLAVELESSAIDPELVSSIFNSNEAKEIKTKRGIK